MQLIGSTSRLSNRKRFLIRYRENKAGEAIPGFLRENKFCIVFVLPADNIHNLRFQFRR